MATTPVAPATLVAETKTWIQKHERILIVLMVLLAGAWGFSKFADLSASKAEARATVAEQALAAQKVSDAQNAATVAQVTQQYAVIVQSLQAQNASLAAAVASRQTALVAQQKTDATLPLADLSNRLKTLGNAPDGSISPEANSVNITQGGAVAVVQTLETIPALTANLKDTTDALQATRTAETKADELITDQTKQISNLNLTLVDQTKMCTAQISEVKAQARKSKIKFFKLGFVTGFVAGLWAGHAGGL